MDQEASGSSLAKATKMEIFQIWSKRRDSSTKRIEAVKRDIFRLFGVEDTVEDANVAELGEKVRQICDQLPKRWKKCNRTREKFLKNNANWLKGAVELPPTLSSSKPQVVPIHSKSKCKGRPRKLYQESSDRSRRRKALDIKNKCDENQLIVATQMALKHGGKKDAASLLKEATQSSPARASKIRKVWSSSKKTAKELQPYNQNDALSLIVENNFTKRQYMNIRLQAKDRNFNVYPSYNKVLKAKKLCYPPSEYINITETTMEVKLQALLDHTVNRIATSQKDVLEHFSLEELKNLTLISKWGFDGSTGHSEYKQIMTEEFSDSDIFITSFVPIQLFSSLADKENRKILWQNPKTSSTRYCRPIRIQFKKEATDLSKMEYAHIQDQIEHLSATMFDNISVTHKMVMTMVDGKVCNAVTATTSAQKCYICGATPTQMNDIENVLKKQVDGSVFQFGLSTLHAWIRFFEYFLHVSYRLDLKKWQARGEGEKNSLKLRKETIQRRFKAKMGLIVDRVKPGGSGTSNDGNTARRFFGNPKLSSEILNLNENLIRRCSVILHTMSSEFKINTTTFNEYALKTAQLLVQEYPWYYMPASVHKILIHGYIIIQEALLPIGQLSEEAQEQRNKDLKKYRENYTRKISRLQTNQDLLNRLLITSDPYITSLRPEPLKRKHPVYPEMLQLLLASTPQRLLSDESDLDDDSEEY